SQQKVHFGRAEIGRIDADEHLTAAAVPANLVYTLAAPYDLPAGFGRGKLHELAHRMSLPRPQYIVLRLILPWPAPRALHVVARMAPITLGIEIAEIEAVLQAVLDIGHRARDLACDKRFAAYRALMVEKDAV